MAFPRFAVSIRHQLLLLGAVATAAIWVGALLQYMQLREQTSVLAQVRQNLQAAQQFAELARYAAQERGLSYGAMALSAGNVADGLRDVRGKLDQSVAQLSRPLHELPVPISSRLDQISLLRGQIDRRELPAASVFGYYTGLVEVVQDTAALQQATGMLAVGLPYEHVNYLHRAAELLAQMRGLINGALRAGTEMPPGLEPKVQRALAFYEDALRLHERSAPDAKRGERAGGVTATVVRDTTTRINQMLAQRQLNALGVDASGWWTQATEAVDTVQRAALGEQAVLTELANARIAEVEQRLQLTVAALVVLGLVTMGLALATVWRILQGLTRLLHGIETVGSERNFRTRIDDSRRDEFGIISSGINKLIEVAGNVVEEQQTLSLTDPLTGVLNRRGFDEQIDARTAHGRLHTAPMALLMVDVDHFKSINDTFGHTNGDLVLKGLCQVLRAALRPDDVLARFGGEEFVVLLPGCPLAEGIGVAEKLRQAVATHDFGLGRPVQVSLGVAQFVSEQNGEAWIACADAQLYAAKAGGRNRVMPSAAPPGAVLPGASALQPKLETV